jgi:hypothetical protein
MRRSAYSLLLVAFASCCAVWPSGAEPSAAAEIESLLSAVAGSSCTFIRNGTSHLPADARDHMKLKYDHLRKRIHTAEDFIEMAGSQSSLSGRPYLVECAGAPQRRTRDWLLERLAALREEGSTGP